MGSETGPLKNEIFEDFLQKNCQFGGSFLEGFWKIGNTLGGHFLDIFWNPQKSDFGAENELKC